MLRSAGLVAVRPQAAEPFYASKTGGVLQDYFSRIDQSVLGLELGLAALDGDQRQTRDALRAYRSLVSTLRALRKEVERSAGTVLGESRRKQVDVFLADADRGLELLISTKTFALAADPSELVKNLPNRWEEFDGDLKNLRGRFPLAVIGALTILPAMALQGGALTAFVDMMTKLTAPGRPWVNAYDTTAIVVADWENARDGFVPILNGELAEAQLPYELSPLRFFDVLLGRLFERAPVTEHSLARIRAARARGDGAAEIEEAVEILTEVESDEDAPA
jgi:hypothetical protein